MKRLIGTTSVLACILCNAVAVAQAAQLDGDFTTILPVSLDTGLDCLDY